jgi:hypothetical protein
MMGTGRFIKLLLASGIFFLSLSVHAQELQTVDVIRTNGGSIWRGTITEITSDSFYVLQTLSGLTVRIPDAAIRKVRQQWVGSRKFEKPYSFKEEGFYQTIELSLLVNATKGGLSATYSAGHRFSRWIGVGGGVGITGFEIDQGRNVIPLFVEARGFATQKKVSPYYALRFGYGFALKNAAKNISESKGGYLFNPQVGVRFGGGSAVSYYMGFGLHIQRASYTSSPAFSEMVIVDKYLFKRLELKFGITF